MRFGGRLGRSQGWRKGRRGGFFAELVVAVVVRRRNMLAARVTVKATRNLVGEYPLSCCAAVAGALTTLEREWWRLFFVLKVFLRHSGLRGRMTETDSTDPVYACG